MSNPFIIRTQTLLDERGRLSFLEFSNLPCPVQRIFLINVNDVSISRGGHAHKTCWQIVLPLDSEIRVRTMNTTHQETYHIEIGECLVIPPRNWVTINFFEPHSTALVLASNSYDPEDYIYSMDALV